MTNEIKNVPKLRFPEYSEEWEKKRLKDISKINPKLMNEFPSEFDYIDLESVYKGKINKVSRVTNENAPSRAQRVAQRGDVFFQTVRPYQQNNFVFLDDRYSTVVSTGYAQIRSNMNSFYIYNLLLTSTFLNKVLINCTGSNYPAINSNDLGNISIRISTNENEKQKIGEFFSKLDRQIELEEQKLSLLEEQKKGYMQKLFSQKLRFKDENGNDYPEWEEKTIKDVYKVTRGYVLARKLMSDNPNSINKYPVYSSQTSNNGLMGYYSDYLYQDAITWTTDGANAGSVSFRQGKFYCTNVCGVLLNELGNSNVCMAEMLNNIAFKYVSKVGNPKLMNNVMAMIKLKFPCLEEQQAISKFLNVFSEVIDNQNKKVELLKERKEGLLQKMFV